MREVRQGEGGGALIHSWPSRREEGELVREEGELDERKGSRRRGRGAGPAGATKGRGSRGGIGRCGATRSHEGPRGEGGQPVRGVQPGPQRDHEGRGGQPVRGVQPVRRGTTQHMLHEGEAHGSCSTSKKALAAAKESTRRTSCTPPNLPLALKKAHKHNALVAPTPTSLPSLHLHQPPSTRHTQWAGTGGSIQGRHPPHATGRASGKAPTTR